MDLRRYLAELTALQGRPRVWVLMPDMVEEARGELLRHLDALGTQIQEFPRSPRDRGAKIYLFDLSQP